MTSWPPTDVEWAENEMICDWLGFKKLDGQHEVGYDWHQASWADPAHPQNPSFSTLTFVRWPEAALILDALSKCNLMWCLVGSEKGEFELTILPDNATCAMQGQTPPLAIRAAALAYLASIA